MNGKVKTYIVPYKVKRRIKMRQKKNSKIIVILIILLIILILLTGIAYAYFSTDIFKSNKELFFKYITQMGDEEEGFFETQLKQYFEKQKNTPYLDEGSITVNITASNGQSQFKNTNDMNITFNGQVDIANSQVTQNISLNYSDRVKFPVAYRQIGNTIGLQTTYIGNKYIAVKKDEIASLESGLASEDGLSNNTNSFEKIEEFSNVSFTKEDLQHIKDTYFEVLNQQLQDSDFSKIEEASSKGYQLTLKGENLKKVLVKLLETLKNDQSTLDKMNEYVKIQKNSLKITASSIDNMIKDINNNVELNNENLEIIVYQTKGKTTRLLAKINEVELKLEKMLTGNNQQYNIELQMNNNNQTLTVGLITKFEGLQAMQNIIESHELTLETGEAKYQYNYNNNVEFVDSTDIEAFNNNNSLMLNEAEEEQRNVFLRAVVERLQSVNKSQMEELGLQENENPLQYAIPQFTTYFLAANTMNTSNLNEEEVSAFNNKFENYESTNLQGTTVKGLLSTIQLNNEAQEDTNRKIKEIHFDGQEYEVTDQNITLLKSSVETETAYRVEFEKDEETGIIYRAVINKK